MGALSVFQGDLYKTLDVFFSAHQPRKFGSGAFSIKRTVLKLAFAEPLRYSRDNGYRTAKTTFPFKVLADISTQKCGMVDLTEEESNLLFQVLEEWEHHLAHLDLDGLERDHDETA